MKKKIKIDFVDFWPVFKKKDNLFYNLLSKEYDVVISEDPDIVFYSYYENEYSDYQCIRVLYQGENIRPNFKECDFAFSFDFIPEDKRNFRLPHYMLYDDVKLLTRPKDPEKIAAEKNGFCAFVVSNKLSIKRIEFFRKLSKYKRVDSGGRVLNNVGGPVKDKRAFIRDYKFTLAFENSSYPGYTTEKIFEPMLENSIPIYWGNPLIHLDFNPKSFLNYHDYENDRDFIDRIREIDSNHNLYCEMLAQPYFNDNRINEYVDEEKILNQLVRIAESVGKVKPVATIHKTRSRSRRAMEMKVKYIVLNFRYILYRISLVWRK